MTAPSVGTVLSRYPGMLCKGTTTSQVSKPPKGKRKETSEVGREDGKVTRKRTSIAHPLQSREPEYPSMSHPYSPVTETNAPYKKYKSPKQLARSPTFSCRQVQCRWAEDSLSVQMGHPTIAVRSTCSSASAWRAREGASESWEGGDGEEREMEKGDAEECEMEEGVEEGEGEEEPAGKEGDGGLLGEEAEGGGDDGDVCSVVGGGVDRGAVEDCPGVKVRFSLLDEERILTQRMAKKPAEDVRKGEEKEGGPYSSDRPLLFPLLLLLHQGCPGVECPV